MLDCHHSPVVRDNHCDVSGSIGNSTQLLGVPSGGLLAEEVRDAAVASAVDDETTVERLVLQCANLVCGTTIGILQHPDIKAQKDERRGVDAAFDVLIVDEASKTTFQEFLVPGLLAKRWVLVGDPLQLSPYVEDDEVAASVQAAMPNAQARDACLDVFDNHRSADDPRDWKPTVVVSDEPRIHELYAQQAAARGVQWVDGDIRDSVCLRALRHRAWVPRGKGKMSLLAAWSRDRGPVYQHESSGACTLLGACACQPPSGAVIARPIVRCSALSEHQSTKTVPPKSPPETFGGYAATYRVSERVPRDAAPQKRAFRTAERDESKNEKTHPNFQWGESLVQAERDSRLVKWSLGGV